MSTENWGDLRSDLPLRDVDAGPDDPALPERDTDAGEWPEEMDDVRFYADTSLTIPGMSDPPADCGEWGFREFCDTCGEPIASPKRCQQRKCPDCWMAWAGNDATSITARISAARRVTDGADSRLVHCMASPPPGSITSLVDYWSGFSDAYDLAQAKGIAGGVVLAHGWRVKDRVKRVYRRLSDAEVITEGGLWSFVRENDASWRSQTYWSPHYHVLGLAADVGADHPAEQDGWSFRRLSSDSWFNLTDSDSYEAPFRMAMYLLSHVGFQPDEQKQVVRWFGSLSYNQFGGLDELEDWERSVVRRNVEDVAGRDPVDGSGPEPERDCPDEDCSGVLRSIWHADRWLTDPDWCSSIGAEQQRRLGLAYDWACGNVVPPPGLQRPSSRDQLTESFEVMMEQR